MDNINWYPGHMKKTRELIQENLKMVDLLLEVVDARIPISSRNPIIDEIVGEKKRLVILNKSDLSAEFENRKWLDEFQGRGYDALLLNSMSGGGVKQLVKLLSALQEEKNARVNVKKPLRMMIVGTPNVGKSSLINRLTGKKSAQTGDRPGITKGKQWLTLENGMQLLDTPGILWPKFEDPKVGVNLAICGSIRDEILDLEGLALELIIILMEGYRELLLARYKVDMPSVFDDGEGDALGHESVKESALEIMDAIAVKRGFILPGKRIDYLRLAKTLLNEFRSGALGRITLEKL